MLLLIVLVFVIIDLIILITYTIVAWTMYDEGLVAHEIINSENPEDLQGVSKLSSFMISDISSSPHDRCVKSSLTIVPTSVTQGQEIYFLVSSMGIKLSYRS